MSKPSSTLCIGFPSPTPIMEKKNIVNTTYISSDFQQIRLLTSGPGETSNSSTPNPRKRKRTKFIRNNTTASRLVSNPQPSRKPDPAAPKITRPCTECGRKFWSWKALFGHMRCHPEREWRGIVPPPNFRRRPEITDDDESSVTEEDQEVAAYLLMLANGPPLLCAASDNTATVNQGMPEYFDDRNNLIDPNIVNCGRFECSSCKKVFGSHQALGGHRASHKNVKGCYAITKSIDVEEFEGCCSAENQMFKESNNPNNNNNNNNNNGHKCCICFRVFSSGQALGGHMRCHWEKMEEPSMVFDFDLNLAAPVQEDVGIDDVTSFAQPLNLSLGL